MTDGCWRQKIKFDLLSYVMVGGLPQKNLVFSTPELHFVRFLKQIFACAAF